MGDLRKKKQLNQSFSVLVTVFTQCCQWFLENDLDLGPGPGLAVVLRALPEAEAEAEAEAKA